MTQWTDEPGVDEPGSAIGVPSADSEEFFSPVASQDAHTNPPYPVPSTTEGCEVMVHPVLCSVFSLLGEAIFSPGTGGLGASAHPTSPPPQTEARHVTPALAHHSGNPTLYHSPGLTEIDILRRGFVNSIGESDSAISKYILSDGWTIYFAAACIGAERRIDQLLLPAPEPNLQLLAVKFADPIIKRAVWGHGRYTRRPTSEGLESHFNTVIKEGNWNGIVFYYREIMPVARDAYLAEHNRIIMTLDYNLAIMHPELGHIISILRPELEIAMKNSVVEYVYAVLAALAKLPHEKDKFYYLEHQRSCAYILPVLLTGIDTCIESARLFTDIHIEAEDRISTLFRLLHRAAYVRTLLPDSHLVAAAHDFGATLTLWAVGSKRACVFHGRDIGLAYFSEVNAARQVLTRCVRPTNRINGKEAEYEIYGYEARMAIEGGNPFNFPKLPTTEVWVKPLVQ
ncbi:hypothetical protein B0H11DRAFT_1933514 [Mycena galericulata]|nr:hypothetical protein B0H11DRAFT_1933514 [Mycena galericulata]